MAAEVDRQFYLFRTLSRIVLPHSERGTRNKQTSFDAGPPALPYPDFVPLL